ncbi:hypothetical protein FOZ61_006928 [Perkinsus olseni]|uniref:Carbohydrate kinase PfkB domain-containing protein n=1 Tax=Perkinsus olseni TaxID=32597 RepID=A0A7J6LBJ4_PEROL|nr:hypothetical protein FOZ61_006928 [Perkinsus olseni]KAF4658896.1 hypothetical protein FOL46_006797 [Perkinsus olseni]
MTSPSCPPRWEPLILCVGLVCRDITVEVPTYPLEDSKVVSTGYRESLGGNACNVAVALHKLGAEVELVTKILGNQHGVYDELDTLGMFRHGMVVVKKEGHLGLSYIISSEDSRTIVHSRMSEQMMPDEIPIITYHHFWSTTQVSCLYLDGRFPHVAEVYATEAAVTRGVPVVMDVERSDRARLRQLLQLCTGIIVSGHHTLHDVHTTLFTHVRSIFDACPHLEWIVVTMGGDGAELILKQQKEEGTKDSSSRRCIPSHQVDDVVDTTGAGDAFQAGLVYCMCKRRMLSTKEGNNNSFVPTQADLEFATFLAAENCRCLGAQNTLSADDCREAMTKAAIL